MYLVFAPISQQGSFLVESTHMITLLTVVLQQISLILENIENSIVLYDNIKYVLNVSLKSTCLFHLKEKKHLDCIIGNNYSKE